MRMYDPDFLHPIFTLECLWLSMLSLIMDFVLDVVNNKGRPPDQREKPTLLISMTVLKYEFKVKHWFTFALVKLFEISIKSASKFSRVGQMKSHKLFSIKK